MNKGVKRGLMGGGLFAALLLLGGMATAGVRERMVQRGPTAFGRGTGELPPLDLVVPIPARLAGFGRSYGLDFADSIHHAGRVDTAGLSIAVHAWLPAQARGTVFYVHGYYDHSGHGASLVRELLGAGWAVVSWDQPGHGLSSGPWMSADSMGTYANAMKRVEHALAAAPRPWVAVGHSLGGATLLERARDTAGYPYRSTVLLAPMVRFRGWGAARVLRPVLSLFTDGIKRGPIANSHDTAWCRRLSGDSLEGFRSSFGWMKAVQKWEPRLETARFARSHWSLFQGDSDATVDFRHDLPLLQNRIPQLEVYWFAGARHHLHNEGEPWRTRVRTRLLQVLDSAALPRP